jgi:hypothetical protein
VSRRRFGSAALAALGGVAMGAWLPRHRALAGALDAGGPPGHPYLFFGPGDVAAIRERCGRSLRGQLDVLVTHADAHAGDAPPSTLSGDYEQKGDALQAPFLSNILAFSFLAAITGDARYRSVAKRWALALASMRSWAGTFDDAGRCTECGYPEGWGVTALAVAYDWLYPHFDDRERTILRDKISAVTRALYQGSIAGEWWTGALLHHDTWIPLGGLGLGAMAVLDEAPEAPAWAERAEHELFAALDWLDDDGAWPEGPAGWAFALASAVPFWAAYARRFPSRGRALLDHPWVARCYAYRLHARTPDGQFLGFGDSSPSGSYQENAREAGPPLRFLAARYGNEHAQWLAAREWEQVPNPYTAAWEILFADPAVGEAPPDDLPHGILFDNQAMAYLRTGWDAGSTIVGFRSTALLGRRATSLFEGDDVEAFNNSTTHTHADAGAFGVWSRGGFAITMARYGQRETAFHNSLLVDGQGQYTAYGRDHVGRPDGWITHFFAARHASLAAGEAAACYRPGLRSFARRVFLVDPGVVFVIDAVSADAPVHLEWRLHVDLGAAVDLDDAGFTSTLHGLRTTVRLAGPPGVDLGLVSDRYNHGVILSAPGARASAELAAVVIPSLPAGDAPFIATPSERSFVVEALGVTVLAAFAPEPGLVHVPGRLSSDGTAAIAVTGADTEAIFVVDATRLTLDEETIFRASSPVTASYHRAGATAALTVDAPVPARVTLLGTTVEVPAGTSDHALQR